MAKDRLEDLLGKIHQGDCVEGLAQLPAACIDLAFADPPFNIGYEYDEYDDQMEESAYLKWCSQWMSQLYRVLKPSGSFWLAIGDEYAAELKVEAKRLGFKVRNWVIWYYTFGVHCHSKFTRSHAHLFYFVKDPQQLVFNFPEIAVPSARQLVYNDKRGNPTGRSPDDTWILRPQDCVNGFRADEDTWYFPRVAGTHKERAGFHGCQMPEQLLGRIIRASSCPGDIVLDPFSGSSTTLVVAKKLDRKFLGFELSKEYVQRGTDRLQDVSAGDLLEGAEEPLGSAPSSYARYKNVEQDELTIVEQQLDTEAAGLIEAFAASCRGFSVDRLIADPILNEDFQVACNQRALPGTTADRNRFLFRLRKSGRLRTAGVETQQATNITWTQIDDILHASEIAWSITADLYNASLDEIFCDPRFAAEFDLLAAQFAPGRSTLELRWAALKLRKEAGVRKHNLQGAADGVNRLLKSDWLSLRKFNARKQAPESAGVYAIRSEESPKRYLFIGETSSLARCLSNFDDESCLEAWKRLADCSGRSLQIQLLPVPLNIRLANQLTLLKKAGGSQFNCDRLAQLV